MYFQDAYIDSDFWKISLLLSPFVKANLTFGLIYEAKTQVGLDETGHASKKVIFFYIWTISKRPDGFWKL